MIILDCDQDQFQDVRIWFLIRLLSFIPISAEVEFVKCFTPARFPNVPREGVKNEYFTVWLSQQYFTRMPFVTIATNSASASVGTWNAVLDFQLWQTGNLA